MRTSLFIPIDDIAAAVDEWPSQYRTREGETVTARRVAEVGSVLSRNYRGASRLDASDFKRMGVRVVEATYIQGAHPTGKFCDVIVKPEFNEFQRAYLEGALARKDGTPVTKNPHSRSDLNNAWQIGWLDADKKLLEKAS